jgi:hypothetical protein
MKLKLTPVTGLVIAGLIGTAYATCYHAVSGCCGVNGGDDVDTAPSGSRSDYIASGDWCPGDYPEVTADGGPTTWTALNTSAICHGPAGYIDSVGHYHFFPDYTPRGTMGLHIYTNLDFTSPHCSD